jgi:DeoR/GlpR family transcriptional regulator of sugar metabolism
MHTCSCASRIFARRIPLRYQPRTFAAGAAVKFRGPFFRPFPFARAMSSQTSLSPQELAKQKAAHQAVDAHIRSGMKVGIGSGSTVVYAVERLVQRVRDEKSLSDVVCVASSFQAVQLITEGGLVLSDLSRTPRLDVAIDGADEVDSARNCIKGGGACMLQEKVVASCADKFIVIADTRKDSKQLGQQVRVGHVSRTGGCCDPHSAPSLELPAILLLIWVPGVVCG